MGAILLVFEHMPYRICKVLVGRMILAIPLLGCNDGICCEYNQDQRQHMEGPVTQQEL